MSLVLQPPVAWLLILRTGVKGAKRVRGFKRAKEVRKVQGVELVRELQRCTI